MSKQVTLYGIVDRVRRGLLASFSAGGEGRPIRRIGLSRIRRRELAAGLGLSLLVLLTVVFVIGSNLMETSTFGRFLGRFHPAVVHFPIGILLVAAALEGFVLLAGYRSLRLAIPFVLVLGVLSSVVAVTVGYLLSLDGGYDAALVGRHMWLGVVVMVLALASFVLAVAVQRGAPQGITYAYRSVLFAAAVLVLLTGHLGGTLTRGPGYLTYYLPESIKMFVGMMPTGAEQGLIANIDSARVYEDLVAPVLERRCVKCHGPNKSKGDLRLDSSGGIEKGSRDGPAVVAGKPGQSEILRRITLPPHDEDAMPPDGEPLMDVGETELIRWWISEGASFEVRVGEVGEVPSAVNTYLNRVAAPRKPLRRGIFAVDVPEPDTLAVAALRRAGFGVRRLSPEAPYLDISVVGIRPTFGDADLALLTPLSLQIAVLALGSSEISSLELIGAMKHLVRLHLEQTSIGDEDLAHLAGLEYLEYLNLYGTSVSDNGVRHLERLTSLRSLYLWQTNVTEAGVERLRASLPKLEINRGSTFAEVAK